MKLIAATILSSVALAGWKKDLFNKGMDILNDHPEIKDKIQQKVISKVAEHTLDKLSDEQKANIKKYDEQKDVIMGMTKIMGDQGKEMTAQMDGAINSMSGGLINDLDHLDEIIHVITTEDSVRALELIAF